jgi:hypothetical protein
MTTTSVNMNTGPDSSAKTITVKATRDDYDSNTMMVVLPPHKFTILLVVLLVLALFELDGAESLLLVVQVPSTRTNRRTAVCHPFPSRPVITISRTALGNSPVDSVFKLVFPHRRQSGVESSIEAALILVDKKRQEEWKKDVGQKYPLIPSFVVDICIDSMSGVFESIAPAEIQAVLRPGGLDKTRPELERGILTSLEQQQVWQGIPLKQEDKRQFLQYFVSMALDFALRDVEIALAKPSAKLQALNAQKREIQKFMTRRQLLWYRLQTYPLQMTLLGVTGIYVVYTLYEATKHTQLMSTMTRTVVSVVSYMVLTIKNAMKVFTPSSSRAFKKKALRRIVRR